MRKSAALLLVGLPAALPAAAAGHYDPGASDSENRIGNLRELSASESNTQKRTIATYSDNHRAAFGDGHVSRAARRLQEPSTTQRGKTLLFSECGTCRTDGPYSAPSAAYELSWPANSCGLYVKV
jgi:hypothetical protein